MAKVYFPTHTRMGAWLVGILLGYFMHNFKQYNQQRIPLVSSFIFTHLLYDLNCKLCLFSQSL